MIAIIDYQSGNLGSIRNMIKRLGHESIITSDPDDILKAEKVILPGVGTFDYGIKMLKDRGLDLVLNQKRKDANSRILGICLGAQLMCKSSEEGIEKGLSWVDLTVKEFPNKIGENRYFVPHMGWDFLHSTGNCKLFKGLDRHARFYFAHSYYIEHIKTNLIVAENNYGITYTSAFEYENVLGVQFHPEKSHEYGKSLLKNFIELY